MSVLSHKDVRQAALSLPETEENAHFGKSDFRVGGKVFATLPEDKIVVLKLSPDQQMLFLETGPAQFEPVKGSWGQKGWTRMDLTQSDTVLLNTALKTAWKTVAPKKILKLAEEYPS